VNIREPLFQRGQSLSHRQFVITVAELSDQLAANFRCRQACVQTVCAKLRIGLTLPIHDGSDIAKQVRQMFFTALATSRRERINTDDPML
jgi:hypothetical protein